jgi:ferritin-like metal-binding protein YciE
MPGRTWMRLESLHDLYVDELRDLYSAETQILKALPKMATAATSQQLRGALQAYGEITESQMQRLGRLLKELGKSSKGKRCAGILGILKEGEQVLANGADPDALDAALIVVIQKVAHYEMAGYGSARAFAGMLGEMDSHRALQQALDEEADTDRALTALAEDVVNVQAAEKVNGAAREP